MKALTALFDRPWSELKGSVAHAIDFEILPREAQRRLEELGLMDWENRMFRIRVDGAGRVWGFRAHHTFHILWWDKDHGVQPHARDPNDRARMKRRNRK